MIEIPTLADDGAVPAYRADPEGAPDGGDHRHPGDFRGQSRRPQPLRPLGRARLSRHRARPVLAAGARRRARSRCSRAVSAGARPDEPLRPGPGRQGYRGGDPLRARRGRRRQGRRGRLLPRRPARLHGRGAHRCERQRRLLWRRAGRAARREARHRPSADAAHRRRRPFRDAGQAGADPRRAGRSSQGDDPRLSRRRPRLRVGRGQAPQRRGGAARRLRAPRPFSRSISAERRFPSPIISPLWAAPSGRSRRWRRPRSGCARRSGRAASISSRSAPPAGSPTHCCR